MSQLCDKLGKRKYWLREQGFVIKIDRDIKICLTMIELGHIKWHILLSFFFSLSKLRLSKLHHFYLLLFSFAQSPQKKLCFLQCLKHNWDLFQNGLTDSSRTYWCYRKYCLFKGKSFSLFFPTGESAPIQLLFDASTMVSHKIQNWIRTCRGGGY